MSPQVVRCFIVNVECPLLPNWIERRLFVGEYLGKRNMPLPLDIEEFDVSPTVVAFFAIYPDDANLEVVFLFEEVQ